MGRWAWVFMSSLALMSCSEPAAPEPPVAVIAFQNTGADLIEHGRRVSTVLGCNGCHGADLQGEDWGDPEFGVLWTSNLTQAVPTYTDAQLEAAIRGGRRPDGSELWDMPSHIFTQLDAGDMAAIIAFLRSRPPSGPVHPRPAFAAGGRAEIEAGLFKSAPTRVAEGPADQPPDLGPPFALGRYLVRATCAECHNLDLRGGTPHPGAEMRPDLRMVGSYEPEAFDRLLREGVAVGDRQVGLMSEVAVGRFSHFTPNERRAVYDYLHRLAARDADAVGP